eukprot:scaffold87654_cov69-Phaeocystis_antarctica.AAC.1
MEPQGPSQGVHWHLYPALQHRLPRAKTPAPTTTTVRAAIVRAAIVRAYRHGIAWLDVFLAEHRGRGAQECCGAKVCQRAFTQGDAVMLCRGWDPHRRLAIRFLHVGPGALVACACVSDRK